MKSKEDVQTIIRRAPISRAFNIAHTSTANTTVGRAFALVLILSGAACILMTQKVYHALPFILGIGMMVIGTTHTICGLWAKEYQSKETKLTANGIVCPIFYGKVVSGRSVATAGLGDGPVLV